MSGSSTTSPDRSADPAATPDAADAGQRKGGKRGKRRDERRAGRKARREAKRTAGTPAEQARRAEKRHRRRGRVAVLSSFLGLVVIVGGLYGWQYYRTHHKPSVYTPQHVVAQTSRTLRGSEGILAGGDGKPRVDVYVDYECPACRSFGLNTAPELDKLVAANAITLVYHPVAVLDGQTRTHYSTRAAASAACASDLGVFRPYSNLLLADQPPQRQAAGLSDDQLVQIAGRAGIIDPKFARCLRSSRYDSWVAGQTAAAAKRNVTVPSVYVNGKPVAAAGATPTRAEVLQALGMS